MVRITSIFLLILLFTLASIFQGCSSSSSADKDPLLDQTVSMEIFNYLMAELMFVGLDFGKSMPDGFQSTVNPEQFQSVFDEYTATVSCAEGGSISQNGTVSSTISEEGTGTIETTMTQSISGCTIATSQGQFVVNGNPNLRSWGRMDVEGWLPKTVDYTFEGGYTWQGEEFSGECSVEITYSINMLNPNNFSMSGHMCGYTY
jgi:hypothetical protein